MAFNTETNGTEPGVYGHILINYSGPSFSELPRDIMFNVLLRLSVKRIFVCKFVCKTWYDLVSEPEFAKLHYNQAQPYPLIQIISYEVQSRMLYLVQPEEEDFVHKCEMCDHSKYKSKCDCRVQFELDTKFKLPLCNLQMIFDDVGFNMLDHVSGEESNDCIQLEMEDHKYHVVNSCNGLLFLSNPSDDVPLVVCNPITGEFINLPNAKKVSCRSVKHCGFGYSPAANQYKVVRMFQSWTRVGETSRFSHSGMGAEVHTLGTETWKDIDFSAQDICGLCPTYLNGFLYWPYIAQSLCAISFDIENECFGFISAPPMNSMQYKEVRVGALGGELSISCYFTSGAIGVWVLKDNGTTNVWSKVFFIHSYSDKRWPCGYGLCQPIKYLNDGALLMFHSRTNSLIYTHPRKHRFRYFKIRGTGADLNVIAHIPSFVSLKDALSGHDVKVLKSRCSELKLQHEGASFSVLEKEVQWLRGRE